MQIPDFLSFRFPNEDLFYVWLFFSFLVRICFSSPPFGPRIYACKCRNDNDSVTFHILHAKKILHFGVFAILFSLFLFPVLTLVIFRMPPKNFPKPKNGPKGVPKVPPLQPVVVADIAKTPKVVAIVKTPLKRLNVDDGSKTPDQSKSRRLSGDTLDDGAESDADLKIEMAVEKRTLLSLKLQRIKSKNERLRSLEIDDVDGSAHFDESVGDDAGSPGISSHIKKSPSSRTSSSLSPFNSRRVTSSEEATVVSDTLLQCDFAASISALGAGLFCKAIINSVITPNSTSAVPASVVGLLKGLSDHSSPLSMRTIATRDVAVALARSFTPAFVARFLKDPRSPLCVSVFLNANKGAFYSGDDMSTLTTTKFTSFSNESGSELLQIVSRWQSLVSVFDPTFGAAASGLLRCCSELLSASTAPLVVFRYVCLMRQNVSIGSMISDSMATLFVIDQNALNQARLLAGPIRPTRAPPAAVQRPTGDGRDNHPRGRDNHPRDTSRRDRNNHDNRDSSADDRPKGNFCRNWNDSLACFRSPCGLDHKCSFCSSKFHIGQACPDRQVDRLQILASPKAVSFQ